MKFKPTQQCNNCHEKYKVERGATISIGGSVECPLCGELTDLAPIEVIDFGSVTPPTRTLEIILNELMSLLGGMNADAREADRIMKDQLGIPQDEMLDPREFPEGFVPACVYKGMPADTEADKQAVVAAIANDFGGCLILFSQAMLHPDTRYQGEYTEVMQDLVTLIAPISQVSGMVAGAAETILDRWASLQASKL